MIRQVSATGLVFKAPRYVQNIDNTQHVVTEESLQTLNNIEIGKKFSGVTVDIIGVVKDIPFVLYVTYKDRHIPYELKHPSVTRCGIVELSADHLSRVFKDEKNGRYTDSLLRYLREDTQGKTWVYHPRSANMLRKKAQKNSGRIDQEIPGNSDLKPNRPTQKPPKQVFPNSAVTRDLAREYIQIGLITVGESGYECAKCGRPWKDLLHRCKT